MKSISNTPYKDAFSLSETDQKQKYRFSVLGKIVLASFFALSAVAAVYSIIQIDTVSAINDMDELEFMKQYSQVDLSTKKSKELEAISLRALSMSPPNLNLSKSASLQAIKLSSRCPSCENRLVYIDILENKTLTSVGIEHLNNSYEISPYGPSDQMRWRLQIADFYWSSLPKTLQQRSLYQITALAENPKDRRWMKNLTPRSKEIKARLEAL